MSVRPGSHRFLAVAAMAALLVFFMLSPASARTPTTAASAGTLPASASVRTFAAGATAGTLGARATTGTAPIVQAPEEQHAAAQEVEHAEQQEHVEEAEHEAEPKPWFYWPAKWINFILLVALLYWMLVIPPPAVQEIFSFPGLRAIFAQRADAIIVARNLAAEQREQATRMLAESEQRLAKIAEEVAALASDARLDAEREQRRARDDGNAQAEKILEVAGREVKHERVTAQRRLRAFVADLAVSLAKTNLAEHLTPDDQDRLIREYLSRLGQTMA